jgi:hypothetical protein
LEQRKILFLELTTCWRCIYIKIYHKILRTLFSHYVNIIKILNNVLIWWRCFHLNVIYIYIYSEYKRYIIFCN